MNEASVATDKDFKKFFKSDNAETKTKPVSNIEQSKEKIVKVKSPIKGPIVNGGYISDEDDIPLATLAKQSPPKKKQSSLKINGSMRKNTMPQKKKQATLLELTTKKGGMKLMKSVKSPTGQSSPRRYVQPPIVFKLLSLKKTDKTAVYHKTELM